jgi:hypothetical protein
MLAARRFIPNASTASSARLRWCSQLASASAWDSLNLCGERRFERPRRGRTIKDAPLARETVEQVDDFAGRVEGKRLELAPRASCPLSRKG